MNGHPHVWGSDHKAPINIQKAAIRSAEKIPSSNILRPLLCPKTTGIKKDAAQHDAEKLYAAETQNCPAVLLMSIADAHNSTEAAHKENKSPQKDSSYTQYTS